MMKVLLRAEYAIAFLFIFFIYTHLEFSIWLFILLLLMPDVTMLGYIVNKKVGTALYNVGHSMLIPTVLCWFAIMSANQILLMFALIWLAHIFMDRAVGYGLKYSDSFQETHMQKV